MGAAEQALKVEAAAKKVERKETKKHEDKVAAEVVSFLKLIFLLVSHLFKGALNTIQGFFMKDFRLVFWKQKAEEERIQKLTADRDGSTTTDPADDAVSTQAIVVEPIKRWDALDIF